MIHSNKIVLSFLEIFLVVIFSTDIFAKNPKYGGEVVWGIAQEPVSLAPFGVLLGAAQIGKQLGYDSLVEYDQNFNIQPALATHWENPDDRTWIFHLRKGVKFHDGTNFSAEDVIYSLTHMRDPTALDASAASVDGFMPSIESFEAIDKYTIKIVTPTNQNFRGCQLSIIIDGVNKEILDKLYKKSVICDFREPNVLRIAPVPLYNSFSDCFNFVKILKNIIN